MDETYIKVKGKWHYLYHAIDKFDETIDICLKKIETQTQQNHFPTDYLKNMVIQDA